MISKIFFAIAVWAIVTVVMFVAIQKFRSEKSSLFGGALFLVGAFAAVLLLPGSLGTQENCNTAQCLMDRQMASSLVTFFTITWGAFGANLLSACITHKQA